MEELNKAEPVLGDIESINNLDTARMSLRWALERIHSLQKAQAEQEEKARALLRKDALRETEQHQRQRYYARLEELLAASRTDAEAASAKRALSTLESDNANTRAALREAREAGESRERVVSEETARILTREAGLRAALEGRLQSAEELLSRTERSLEKKESDYKARIAELETENAAALVEKRILESDLEDLSESLRSWREAMRQRELVIEEQARVISQMEARLAEAAQAAEARERDSQARDEELAEQAREFLEFVRQFEESAAEAQTPPPSVL